MKQHFASLPEITVEQVRQELARRNIWDFSKQVFTGLQETPFHRVYYEVLNRFAKGEIKRLIVTVPPQHGKSQGSTRLLPAFMLGRNPNLKIAIGSYNSTFARKFNRDIQRIIDTQEYYNIFPNTTLNNSNVVTVSSSYLRNSDEFEIVDHQGSLKVVGRGGPLTGNMVDVMIMDDLYKDYEEGNSPIVRASVLDWYTSVVKTRLHNNSQELIVFTRWHEDDLIGSIEKAENVVTIKSFDDIVNAPAKAWIKINFEALKTGEPTELDQRSEGASLWDDRHNEEKLLDTRKFDPEMFECLYQGNPKSKEGLLYGKGFMTYSERPEFKIIRNYTDVADGGGDYLCSICYGVGLHDNKAYLIDVLYTSEGMDRTEEYLPLMLQRNGVNIAKIESNNGGKGFARIIDKATADNISIESFHQTANKESRIYSNSANVMNNVLMPNDWHIRWPDFYRAIMDFKKTFKANKQDDAPDALTGVVENLEEGGFYFG